MKMSGGHKDLYVTAKKRSNLPNRTWTFLVDCCLEQNFACDFPNKTAFGGCMCPCDIISWSVVSQTLNVSTENYQPDTLHGNNRAQNTCVK